MPALTRVLAVSVVLLSSSGASAQPDTSGSHHVTLRMAVLAPNGTAWARIFERMRHDVLADTDGQVEIRWYLGGIAGDERKLIDRVRRGQLDGMAGVSFCDDLAPVLRATRLMGLMDSRAQAQFLAAELEPEITQEMHQVGFTNLGIGGVGPKLIFSRMPISSAADLWSRRLWMYAGDVVGVQEASAAGMHLVAGEYDAAARAYESGDVDGFLVSPTAALAWQLSARAAYLTNLWVSYSFACMVVSDAAMARLTAPERTALEHGGRMFQLQWEQVTGAQEQQLVGALFAHQGLKTVSFSEDLRREFHERARVARERLPLSVVKRSALARVLGALSKFVGR